MSLDTNLPEDQRINFWGRFLRSSSIDELPELINILKGEMSFVGPRPLLPEYLDYYNHNEMKRHDVIPGLTGLAQINGRNAISWEEKFEYDLQYIKNQSFLGDIKIILSTFLKVLKKTDINTADGLSMERFDNPFYIIGASGHGVAIAEITQQLNINLRGHLDDSYSNENDTYVLDKKVLSNINDALPGRAIIAIGNNKIRKKLSENSKFHWQSLISPTASVHPSASIGEGTVIMNHVHIGPNVTIGKHVIINNGAHVEHDSTIGDFSHIAPNAVICGTVAVGDSCFIGANSTLKNNIQINSYTTIGAGAVVIKNINEQNLTFAGNPSRVLRSKGNEMKTENIDLKMASPIIEQDDIDAVVEVMKTGHLSLGPKILEFEKKFCELTGCKHAVAVSSGTAGLHVSMLAMGIGPGDEVIVPSFTFVSSVSTIVHVGATPVFVDIEPETYCIDPVEIEKLITPKTKAIMVVDVFGHPANWTALNEIADKYSLYTIDDSCEALGAKWNNEMVGSFADTSVFAFYPNKQITTGEGGIVVTNDDILATKMQMYRNHGRSSMGKWLKHDFIGYNYRMNEMSAALGVSQMNKLDKILEGREVIAEKYNTQFKDFKYLRTQVIKREAKMSWFVYVVTLDNNLSRDEVIQELQEHKIPARAYFEPIHSQPMMEKIKHSLGKMDVTENIANRTIALPFHAKMSDVEIEYISMTLKSIISKRINKGKIHDMIA